MQFVGSCQRTKNFVEKEGGSDTNFRWNFWNGSKSLEQTLGEFEIKRRLKIVQTTGQLKLVRIQRIVLKI